MDGLQQQGRQKIAFVENLLRRKCGKTVPGKAGNGEKIKNCFVIIAGVRFQWKNENFSCCMLSLGNFPTPMWGENYADQKEIIKKYVISLRQKHLKKSSIIMNLCFYVLCFYAF